MLDQINIEYYSIKETDNIHIVNNDAHTIVVCRESDLTTESKDLLNKMLTAVKLSDAQINTLAIADQQSFHLSQVLGASVARTILVFGYSPSEVALSADISKYRPIRIGKDRIVFSDSLSTLITQPALKKPLWASLQHLYLQAEN